MIIVSQIKAGYACRSTTARMAGHGRTPEMARENLLRCLKMFRRALMRYRRERIRYA